MTTIYMIKHSIPLDFDWKGKNLNYNDSLQVKNEKSILSIKGEEKAKILSELKELENIDCVISSNYVRAMETAKYIADQNNLNLLVDDDFGERKFGIDSFSDLPKDFFIRQQNEENYKLYNGESQKEVRSRMEKALLNVLEQYKNKRIAIVSHGIAIAYMLLKWCEIETHDSFFYLKLNNEVIFQSPFKSPDMFKLVFNECNELISIENIRPKELCQ